MSHISKSINLLQEVFHKLIDVSKVEESEFTIVYNYLFNKNEPYYLSHDTRLYEASEHLKHIITRNNIKCVDELLAYYDLKKAKARKYIQEAINQTREHEQADPNVTVLSVTEDDVAFKNVKLWQTNNDNKINIENSLPISTCDILLLYDSVFKMAIDKATKKGENLQGNDSINVCIKPQIRDGFISCKSDSFLSEKANPSPFMEHLNSLFIRKIYKDTQGVNQFRIINYSNIENFICQRLPLDQELFKLFEVHKPIKDDAVRLKIITWVFYSKLKYSGFRKYFFHGLARRVRLNSTYKDCGIKKKGLFRINDIDSFVSEIYTKKLANKKWLILKSPIGHSWNISENVGISININDIEKGLDCLNMEFSLRYIRRDTIIYIPLSESYCLRIAPWVLEDERSSTEEDNNAIEFEQSSKKELELVNTMIFSTTDEPLVSPPSCRVQKKTISRNSDVCKI